jgi:hypothetical protein
MYSRPSTSTVNALQRVSIPNAPSIIGDSRITRSADGRLLDFRNPSQLLRNAEARTAEVTNFISGITKVAKPLVNDALLKQANTQVGELLATQDPVQLIRSSDPEQRSMVRALSPQARDILQDKAAGASSRMYLEIYQAERTKRSAILQSPTATPEEKVKAETEAKGIALERSGLAAVEPSYLVKYSDGVMQGEAQLKGLDYKATYKAQDENEKAQYRGGLRSDILDLRGQRMAVVSRQGDVGAWAAAVKRAMEEGIVNDSTRYTPAEQAQLWGESIQEELVRLTASDQWDEAITTVETLRGLAAAGIKTPAGIDFFDQKLQSGVSLRYLLESRADELEKGYRQFQQRQVLEDNRDTIRQALQGDPNAEVGFQQALQNPGLTAEQMLTLGQTITQATSIGSRPTQQQQLTEAELRYRIAQGGFDPDRMWAEVKQAGLKPSQVLGLAGQITSGSDDSTRLVAGARQYLSQETIAAGAYIAEVNGTTDAETTQTITRDLQNAASRATEERIAALQANGEQVTVDQARDLFRNELEAIRNTRLKEAKAGASAYKDTPDRRVAQELVEFQQNVQGTNGKVEVASFPKAVREGFQAAFPGRAMTVPALEKYLMNRMNQIKTPDGKPVYANPQKTLQDIIKPIQKRNSPLGSPNPDNTYGQLTNTERLLGVEGARALNWLLNKARGQSEQSTSARPQSVRNADQAKPQRQANAQPNIFQSAMSLALRSIGNVVTPPAAAGTLDSQPETINQEAIDILNKVWTKREPLSVQTPPLPQLSATAATQLAPIAISNDTHPLFVAIGIAEGTRTANGGYTKAYYGHRDPGNGVWNVGTVSGQQGGSPRSSDQRWMAKLTRQASSVAPLLQRMGVRPGTQGWNRLMFNVLDLAVQAPAAVPDFVRKLPAVLRQGATVEAIAKARADSFYNPRTGRLEAAGFGNSYSRLFADQRSRAGVWDYRRRI